MTMTVNVEKHPSKNFGELFWRPVALYPDKTVIRQGEVSLTYAELDARTQQVAAALARLGIGRDDKVMLLMTNDYRFVESLFGIIRIGAVAVPANIKLGNDALIYIAEHSDSRVLIAHEELADKAQAIHDGAANIERTLLVDGDMPGMLRLRNAARRRTRRFHDGGSRRRRCGDDDVHIRIDRQAQGLPTQPREQVVDGALQHARDDARAVPTARSSSAPCTTPTHSGAA